MVSSLGEVKRRIVLGPVVVFALPVASPASELVADRVVHPISDDAPALIGCNVPHRVQHRKSRMQFPRQLFRFRSQNVEIMRFLYRLLICAWVGIRRDIVWKSASDVNGCAGGSGRCISEYLFFSIIVFVLDVAAGLP